METKFRVFFLFLLFQFSLTLNAQIYNQKVLINKTGDVILIGECTRDVFQDKEFREWFNEEYNTYKYSLKTQQLDSLKDKIPNLTFTIVMGTWCSDSRFHFPHFMAILDYLDVKPDQYQIIAVNRNKNAITVPIDHLNIERIPTFIIYENEKELGRIVESPLKSLEEDLLDIILSPEN